MHAPVEPWERAFRTRLGMSWTNMVEVSRLNWKRAAARYAVLLIQLFSKDTSVEE